MVMPSNCAESKVCVVPTDVEYVFPVAVNMSYVYWKHVAQVPSKGSTPESRAQAFAGSCTLEIHFSICFNTHIIMLNEIVNYFWK